MPIEDDCRNQCAVLWAATGTDDDGRVTVAAADEVMVRWEDNQGELQNGRGNVVAYDAIVYPGEVIAKDSVLYLGTEDEYDADTDPELYRVVGDRNIPDVKGRNIRRSVVLARSGSSLPAFT